MNEEILFEARIPDQGSHRVCGADRQPIEFTAVQHLFHELCHARHLANGAWRYFDSEGQAIEDKNRFRKGYGRLKGESWVALRVGARGLQFWWPEAGFVD